MTNSCESFNLYFNNIAFILFRRRYDKSVKFYTRNMYIYMLNFIGLKFPEKSKDKNEGKTQEKVGI